MVKVNVPFVVRLVIAQSVQVNLTKQYPDKRLKPIVTDNFSL